MKLTKVRASRFRECFLEEQALRVSPPRFVANAKSVSSVALGESEKLGKVGSVHLANKALKLLICDCENVDAKFFGE